jgi:hypothetical protein
MSYLMVERDALADRVPDCAAARDVSTASWALTAALSASNPSSKRIWRDLVEEREGCVLLARWRSESQPTRGLARWLHHYTLYTLAGTTPPSAAHALAASETSLLYTARGR